MSRCILGLLVLGCYDPDLGQSRFLCESECPQGFACVDGECTRDPAITIVEPADGDELDATDSFDLVVEIANFKLQPDLDAEPADGEGHWHWYIDGNYQYATADSQVEVGPQEPGCHVLGVDLRQSRHAPLDPPREDEIVVTLLDVGPAICIESPPRGETLAEGLVTITVRIYNFNLETGHWHAAVDNVPTGDHFHSTSGTISISAEDAKPNRTITVELVNDDESPLDPPRTASVTVTVTAR